MSADKDNAATNAFKKSMTRDIRQQSTDKALFMLYSSPALTRAEQLGSEVMLSLRVLRTRAVCRRWCPKTCLLRRIYSRVSFILECE